MSEGLTRHPLCYTIVGMVIYGVGGIALFLNASATTQAFVDEATPRFLASFIAMLFSAISVGVGLFLSSPRTWGELWSSFIDTTKNAGRYNYQMAPKWLTAILLATLIVLLFGFFVFVYAADWYSTWKLLASFEIKGIFLISSCLALIIGPETCFILGNSVFRMGQHVEIPHLQEKMHTEPQITYLREVRKGRVQMAKEAGQRDSQQYQR